jgi:hypothetical protein
MQKQNIRKTKLSLDKRKFGIIVIEDLRDNGSANKNTETKRKGQTMKIKMLAILVATTIIAGQCFAGAACGTKGCAVPKVDAKGEPVKEEVKTEAAKEEVKADEAKAAVEGEKTEVKEEAKKEDAKAK